MKAITLIILTTLLFSGLYSSVTGQTGRLNHPAPPQAEPVLIKNGTLYTISNGIIEDGWLAFEEGIITYAGNQEGFEKDTTGWNVIDAQGKNVYPGIIAANTRVGLVEIDQIRATRDYNETGRFNPNVRSIVAYNTDSDIIPTLRSNGILLVQAAPSGGHIPGASSIVQLDAWNWEDAAYHTDNAMHLNWPGRFSSGGWWASPEDWDKNEIDEALDRIYDFFEDAYSYYKNPQPESKNLKLEAMNRLFAGGKKLFARVHEPKGIKEVIDLADKYNLELVLVGARDAGPVLDLIADKNIPVVLDRTHNNPSRPHDDIYMPYRLPAKLHEKGITFTFGRHQSWRIRNFPFYAGTAVAHGLPHEAGLHAITLGAAEILGIDERTGSLDTGKDANIIISSGDILDMKKSKVEHAFINGRNIDLMNHQEQLYRIYMGKYGIPFPENR